MSTQIALSFLCGILVFQSGSGWWCLPPVGVAVVLLAPLFRQKKTRECMLRLGLFLAAFCLGACCQIREERIWQRETEELFAQSRISVCGTLIRKEKKTNSWQLTLALPGVHNRVIISSQDGDYPLDAYLTVEGSVEKFENPRNEGQFNQRQYYKCKGIMGRITDATIRCEGVPQGIFAWREALFSLRTRMCQVYEQCLPQQSAGMLQAMVTGERSLMDAQVKRLFQVAGFSHILAISGLHISLIGRGIYRLLRKSRRGYGCCCILGAGTLLIYGELIGWGVSTRRAIAMFLIYLLGQYLGKSYDLWSALSAAAILLLAGQPFLLGDAGFRLSFAAVMGVAVSGDLLKKSPMSSIWLAVLLQLFTLPLVAYSYYEVPLYALLLNFLLLPYAGLIVGFGLIGGLVGVIFLPAASLLLLPSRIVATVYIWVCSLVDQLPCATIICGQPPMLHLVLYYLLLFGTLILVQNKKLKKHHRPMLLAGTTVALLVLLLLPSRMPNGLEIDYLDVGQGDGALIKSSNGTVCFVDGGSSDVSQVGTYRILPFLKSKGIEAVDYWIISHADEDHVSGFYEVLEAGFTVRCVIVSEYMAPGDGRTQLCGVLEEYGVPLRRVMAGQTLSLGTSGEDSAANIYFLAPEDTVEDANEASLVFVYQDADVRAFFGGDIGTDQELALLQKGLAQPVDLYKASHHGSRYSNSEDFLAAIVPRLSIISCGLHNRYGHPADEAIQHIEDSGSRICYTMYSGQIKVRHKNGGLYIEEYASEERD